MYHIRRMKMKLRHLIHHGLNREDWIVIIVCSIVSLAIVAFLGSLQNEEINTTNPLSTNDLQKKFRILTLTNRENRFATT